MDRSSVIVIFASFVLIGAATAEAGQPVRKLGDERRSQCFDVLVRALDDPSPWVRVHAAEALVALKRPEPAIAAFRPKSETIEPRYRIVVWRVLAAAEPELVERHRYVERIRAALLDPNGADQTHAMEALAKLCEPPRHDAEQRRIREVAEGSGPASPFAIWRLAQAGDAGATERLVELLRAADATTRARAAYVLGRLQPNSSPTPVVADAITAVLATEPADSPAHPMLRAALGGDAVRQLASNAGASPSGRYFAVMRLVDCGTADDYAMLSPLLRDADPDVGVAAAYALLRIDTRIPATAPSPERP